MMSLQNKDSELKKYVIESVNELNATKMKYYKSQYYEVI